MMLRRALLSVLLTLLAFSPATGQDWARKMFKETDHNFGNVARNATAEFRFGLSNIYMEDIHIASVRSSCGCTSPTIEKPWLKTYEKGTILAHINTDKFLGRKGATVTVTIDKPFHAQVQLHVKVYIRSDVVVSPGSVQLGTVDQGQAAEKTVAITHTGASTWQITDVKSANPHLSAEVVQRTRQSGRVTYDLKVRMDREIPVGYIRDHLVLLTNDGSSRQIPVLVEGRVDPGISVSPAALFMGVVQPGATVTKRLVVKGKKPFRILSVSCEDEAFEFSTSALSTEAKTLHLVPVTFVAGTGTGKVAKKIRIETDLGESSPVLDAYAVISNPSE